MGLTLKPIHKQSPISHMTNPPKRAIIKGKGKFMRREGAKNMIIFMLICIAGTVLLLESVWGGHLKHVDSHHFDLMAGDEGDD